MANRLQELPTSDSKSGHTRQRILDSAAAVLSRTGYAGAKLSDVAAEAQLQAPAIYYYFSSREDLIEEVMWAGIANLRAHVQDVLDSMAPDASATDRILAAVEAHLRFSLSISEHTTAAVRNSGQIPDRIRSRHDIERREYGRLWRHLIADAAEDGDLDEGIDLMVAQLLLLGSLNWAAEWWDPRRTTLDVAVGTAKRLIAHGIFR